MHEALSFDRLHSYHSGLFGNHLFGEFKIILKARGRLNQAEVDYKYVPNALRLANLCVSQLLTECWYFVAFQQCPVGGISIILTQCQTSDLRMPASTRTFPRYDASAFPELAFHKTVLIYHLVYYPNLCVRSRR